LDALAIHPYEATPEGVERQVASLVELTKKYNGGKSKPIWVTESSLFGDETPERARPASYLVRLFTLLRTQPEVEHLFWYLAQDYGQDFHNLGLLHGNFDPMGKCTPVMTYPAYANLIQLLDHAVFRQRENTDSRTRIYQFEKARQTIWVCWSTSGTGQINFTANGPVRLINLVGGEQQMFPVHGQVTIMAGDPPVYVMADAGVVTTVTEVPRAEQVLADSARDFSSEQGKDNWTYLYFASNKDGSAAYDPTQAQPMKWEPSPGDWQDYWAGPAGYFFIGEANCSPSVVNRGQGWAVRRWTSPISGLIHIVGQVRRLAQGDGVGVQVYLDGNKIFSRMLTPDSSTTIDLNLVVEKAARLDFVVTPGPGLDANYDATSEEIMILTPSR